MESGLEGCVWTRRQCIHVDLPRGRAARSSRIVFEFRRQHVHALHAGAHGASEPSWPLGGRYVAVLAAATKIGRIRVGPALSIYESWENVWGVWNGIVPRDGEALRRVATMLRFLGGARGSGEDVLHSAGWVPHTPEVVQSGVYASKWPANPSPLPTPPAAATGAAASPPAATGRVLNAWTLVNRAGRNFAAPTAMLRVAASSTISRFFDCYAGAEIHPTAVIFEGGVEGGAEAGAGVEDLRRRTAGAPPLLQQLAFPIEVEGFG